MAQDLESLLKEVFGEPLAKLGQLKSDQVKKLTSRLQDMAREAVKEELHQMHTEIGDLKARIARLEQERAQAAAESVEPSF